jgi:DNA invertase Pin-like site-specific DNA recombinase
MPVSAPNSYVIYARKSSESEDRQVLSIDAQVQELKNLAARRGFEVVDTLIEAQSAKEPGRPVFNGLVRQVSQGKVRGILCWKLDRLARNPVDGGSIIWAMKQQGLSIQTPTQSYSTEEDNLILMYIEFGMAQKYIDDLSRNIQRGNRLKLERGWLPGCPPVGYLNNRLDRTIVPDPDRFSLVRRMWEYMLTGRYTGAQICRIANEEWGFRTRQTRHTGGAKLHTSTLYGMFANPFYYGLIQRRVDGQLQTFAGAHQPMITEEEFWQVQKLIGREGLSRPQKHTFNYTGLMVCGECGSAITAEEHRKKSGKRYVYYRCTRKRAPCRQPFISEVKLEDQVREVLSQITINDDFREWGIERLKKAHGQEVETRTRMYQSQQAAYNTCQKQLDNLLSLRLRDLISEEEYLRKRQELQREQVSLKLKLADTEDRADKWLELAEGTFIFANQAQNAFNEGSDEQRREIFAALGSNFLLKDRMISIKLKNPFELLQNANTKNEQRQLTPASFVSGGAQSGMFELLVDRIGEYFREESGQFHYIPRLAA